MRRRFDKNIVTNIIKYKGSKSRNKLKGALEKNSDLVKKIDEMNTEMNNSNNKMNKKYKSRENKKNKKSVESVKSIKSAISLDGEIEIIKDNAKKNNNVKNDDSNKVKSRQIKSKSKDKTNNISDLSDEITPKTIHFTHPDKKNLINQFKPNLTPRQIFLLGSFGGNYWRPIFSGVLKKNLSNQHLKYKSIFNPHTNKTENFFEGIDDNLLTRDTPDIKLNKYGVHAGTSLEDWEQKDWIKAQDPYGWVQWYFEFYCGRRSDDDDRQIRRWLNFSGPNGRFYRRLVNMIIEKGKTYDDYSVSPIIRQSLQHWGYQITASDIEK